MTGYRPEMDGLTHINIYSLGRTALGRMMSNFAYIPTDTVDGRFNSIEGYWYWLLAPRDHPRREELRQAIGIEAKRLGRSIRSADWPDTFDWFQERIVLALLAKVAQHDELRQLLIASSLPFTHYYVYGTRVIDVERGEWLVQAWEYIRRYYQEGAP